MRWPELVGSIPSSALRTLGWPGLGGSIPQHARLCNEHYYFSNEKSFLQGPTIKFDGYTDSKATEKKILTDVLEKGDRYFRTGDLLRYDEDNFVWFVDRVGDTFRWKGENVSTGEVAAAISDINGITEANVYGVKIPGTEDGRACMVAVTTEDQKVPDFNGFLKLDLVCGISSNSS